MSRDEQIKAAAAAIRLCPAFADFSSPPMKCANEMAAAAVDALAAQQDGARQCERNFELMLGRLVHRARKGLNLSPTLEQAEELLKRLGSSNMRYEQGAP